MAPLVLYKLKRDYGGAIDIYKLDSSTTDIKTGAKIVLVTVYNVKRAIVLPARQTRASVLATALAKKSASAIGTVDVNSREFIVDRKDTSGLTTLSADDWIVYGGRKYQIEKIEAFELDTGWIITAKELVGETPQQVVQGSADSLLDVTTEVT
jgi:hypothetical protein